MKFKGIIVLVAVMGIAASGWAQEVAKKEKDQGIRIALSGMPGVDEVESNILNSGALEDDGGGQLEVAYVKRYWGDNNPDIGGVLGGGLFFAGHSGLYAGGDEVSLTAFGLFIEGGVAFKAGDMAVIEILPYVGVGGASVEITGFTDGGAAYVTYGVKGAAMFLIGDSVELGLEAGYNGFSSEVEVELFGSKGEATYSGRGLQAGLVLMAKF